MSQDFNSKDAEVRPTTKISKVWFIPIIALLIAAWMVFYQWSNQGELVTIVFKNAEGLEVNSTKVKLRDIIIGQVVKLELSENFDGIIASVRLNKNTSSLLKQDTKFWVVKARIGKSGISGIGTIFSGDYIKMAPGSNGQPRTDFIGLEQPPITPIGTPGLHITLNSDDQFAFSAGDPIIYKGLTVGKFEDVYFNFKENVVYYNAFVNAPYHQLLTENTRFWNISGVKLDLKADGITLKIGSIESLLTNGVTFGVPENMPAGKKITERDYFRVYANYEQANEERYNYSIEYVMLVSNSIRGLSVGAPVEYRGVKIGQVIATNILESDHTTLLEEDMKIPVLVRLQPGRVDLPDSEVGIQSMDAQIKHWIKNGLKATLSTGNLLTGSLFLELQHYDNAKVEQIEEYATYTVIPTTGDDLSQFTRKASAFMDKLNKIPLETISSNADLLILELARTAKELGDSSENISQLLIATNQQQLPLKLNQALTEFTMMSASFGKGSSTHEQLNHSLKVLQNTLLELQPVLKQLNNKPNSLIFSGSKPELIEPKAKGAEK